MTKTETLPDAKELAAEIAAGAVTVEPRERLLTLPAGADPSSADCYPDGEIVFRRGDQEIAVVSCWRVCRYEDGPNRRDNGAWIGPGVHFLVEESDGQSTGRPRHSTNRLDLAEGVALFAADNVGGGLSVAVELDEDGDPTDEALAALDAIQDAIDEAYEVIDVEDADDADVLAWLRAGRRREAARYSPDAPGVPDAVACQGWHAGRWRGCVELVGGEEHRADVLVEAGFSADDLDVVRRDDDSVQAWREDFRRLAEAAAAVSLRLVEESQDAAVLAACGALPVCASREDD